MKFTYSSGQRPLDGYTIKRGIGRGGFGEVYYALSDGGKEVALKLICGNVDVELRGMAQCLNFKHPNLVELYDLRTDQHGDHWVVMEYVTGETLNNVLNRHPNGLAPELAGQWFLGITRAIEYLHDRGVVHRDLKPGNVFLENGNVMVGDFGLARFISGSERNALTQSIGTVHYMAPEISSGNYNKQIDVYAGGIVLYEMLTGHVPFDGESAGEILMKHLTAPPDLARVPAPFRSVLEKSLAKDPARRYVSMAEMSEDVAALIPGASSTVKLTPPPVPHPATPAQGAGPQPIPTVLPVRVPMRIRLSELAGSMLMSAVLALLFCIVWAAVQRTNDVTRIAPYFFLTLACSWAVILPAKMWTTRVEDSWRRRLTLMGLGVLIGVQALWLEGYDVPALFTTEARAAEDIAADHATPQKDSRHSGFAGGWLLRGREVPVAASYLAYFGLVFFFVRWWRMADRRRSRRFSLGTVFMAGVACWLVTLFVWPNDESARSALIDPFMVIAVPASAALVIQLVSPWEAPPPRKGRRMRLPCA